MHRILKRQLKKLNLDKDSLPDAVTWQAFLERVDLAYEQSDEGFYTLKRSGDISESEMVILNEKLRLSQRLLEVKVLERTQDLQETETRNNIFLAMVPSAIIILDQEGRVVEFNDSAERMFGRPREEALNEYVSDIIIPEEFREAHKAALKNFDTGRLGVLTPQPLQLPAMRVDGSTFPTEITLSAFHINEKLFFTAAIQDVTERKVAEEKLTALASFPEENDGPVLRINQEGFLAYSNPAAVCFLKLWNIEVGEKINGNVANIVSSVFDNNETESHEYSVDNKIYMMRFVPSKAGSYINIYGADISVQKAYESALVDAKNLAEQSNHAKSQFLAMMSHEIRTPMNGVMGMTDLLLLTSLSDKQMRYANNIMKSAKVLLRIIDDVLDISKIEADKLELEDEEFNLSVLVRELETQFTEALLEKKLQFKAEVAAEIPNTIIGDSGRLRQILVNLIANAIKFTHEGEIRLVVSVVELDLYFEVVDTGIGMDEETSNRIFEAFSQADQSTTRVYGGTGLGLAIAKRLVSMMEGKLGVRSTLNEGSCFWFTFPLKPTIAAPIEVASIDSKTISIT